MSSTSPRMTSGPLQPRRSLKREDRLTERAGVMQKLRNSTFVIPSTGERSRRTFTLRRGAEPDARNISNQIDGPDDEYDHSNGNTAGAMRPWELLAGTAVELRDRVGMAALDLARLLNSSKGRSIVKCALAYTLASLWTFWGPLSDFLGKPDGKHLVATITVYFHPARSTGSMIEAVLVAVVAVCYAVLVSLLSMCTSVLLGGVLGWVEIAHALVLVVFIGGGFGLIGWVKQIMNNPLVNVGSTLASLTIISVVTQETAVLHSVFSNQKVLQLYKMLVCGVTTTTAVNLLVWRVSATDLLRQSMSTCSTSLGDMLALITSAFLRGAEEAMEAPEFTAAFSSYATVHPQMIKNLRESKFERYLAGEENIYRLERAVVRSIEALSQSIGGLASAANTQFALLRESHGAPPAGTQVPTNATPHSPMLYRSPSSILRSEQERDLVWSAIDEASEEGTDNERNPEGPERPRVSHRKSLLRTAPDIFEIFISLLGPSIKSLAYTLSEVLCDPPFGSGPDHDITINSHFRQSLTDALRLFNSNRAEAVQELYKYIELGRARPESLQADFEEVAASCGHFSFSLQDFGEEMLKYLDELDCLKFAKENKTRRWRWLRWWHPGCRFERARERLPYDAEEQESLIRPIPKTAMPRGISDSMAARRDTYHWLAALQSRRAPSRMIATFSLKLLQLLRKLSRDEVRFGVKVGLGATLWAMLAFIPATRDSYQHWRGEWGLLSFMIVCSMTVGASNTTGWQRFVGTIIGAAASVMDWNLTQGNPLGLILLGWLVAFWSFWMIVARDKAPLGRITLLCYNVSTLYAYSLTQKVDDEDDDDEGGVHPLIWNIVTHRAIAVTAGIFWGLVVCRLVWPISARKKFKEGLSVLYLQMGLIWKRGPLAILLRSDCTRLYLKSGEQDAMQRYASRLESLRGSATSEFELRGPFPFEQYGRIMASTRRILDAFHAMSMLTQRKGRLTDGERALLLFTAQERQMLCARICHVFQVMASSLMLGYPLTDAVPSVAGARDRLLGKIFQFRSQHQDDQHAESDGADRVGGEIQLPLSPSSIFVEEHDYALLYAYALVTGQIAEELKRVDEEIEGLFGVLDKDAFLLQ